MQATTQQKWLTIIEQQKQSDLTILQFCRQLNISPSNFYQRKRELTTLNQSSASFIKAQVTQTVEVEAQLEPICLTLGKAKLTLPSQTSSSYLAILINGLRL